MSKAIPTDKRRLVTDALARRAYLHDDVRIANGDLTGFECLVASRQGLFAAAHDGRTRRIAWGSFFGIRQHGSELYAFESCDRPAHPTAQGRLVRFDLRDGRIGEPRVLARGLDNNCHQIAIIGGLLCVVDTSNQQILRFTLGGQPVDAKPVPGPVPNGAGDDHYRHVNSIAQVGERIGLLLHNGGAGRDRPSELVWLNADWKETARVVLPGRGCHDIASDAHGQIWHCGSMAGEIINDSGQRHKVSPLMTRGLADGPAGFVVGYSQFGIRSGRDRLMGGVLFLDHQLAVRAEVSLDGAPTDLILLDGG